MPCIGLENVDNCEKTITSFADKPMAVYALTCDSLQPDWQRVEEAKNKQNRTLLEN